MLSSNYRNIDMCLLQIEFNKNNLKIFTKEPFLDIIKKIVNNDIFYNNIDDTHYKTIYEIVNNKNPNKIDKIIINQIMKTNITNTCEYITKIK